LLGSLPSDVQFSGGDKAEYDASEDHYGLVPMAGITKNIGVRDETLFALLMIAVSIVLLSVFCEVNAHQVSDAK